MRNYYPRVTLIATYVIAETRPINNAEPMIQVYGSDQSMFFMLETPNFLKPRLLLNEAGGWNRTTDLLFTNQELCH